MDHEVPLEPVADELGWTRFVVTRTPEEGPLTLHPAIGAMEQHRHGFAQPVEGAMEIAPHHLSAVVVPAMALDRMGGRLGHGAGYYDELLARIPVDRPRIGVTVAQFLVGQLPVEPHDVAMTHIVTETEILHIEPPSPWSSP
ncbi:MAG: 5-formyltetrahydrofolate cyclo-ligase, partial [Actinomycetota bacterium]|nr:5-formyltetrahydrofolate cyclo-ligase [Actinomycetota bacterium]